MSLSLVLVALQGCMVGAFAAVVEFSFGLKIVHKDFQLDVNMHAQYS